MMFCLQFLMILSFSKNLHFLFGLLIQIQLLINILVYYRVISFFFLIFVPKFPNFQFIHHCYHYQIDLLLLHLSCFHWVNILHFIIFHLITYFSFIIPDFEPSICHCDSSFDHVFYYPFDPLFTIRLPIFVHYHLSRDLIKHYFLLQYLSCLIILIVTVVIFHFTHLVFSTLVFLMLFDLLNLWHALYPLFFSSSLNKGTIIFVLVYRFILRLHDLPIFFHSLILYVNFSKVNSF